MLKPLLRRIGGRLMNVVNARVNRAAIACLEIKHGERVLDIGFGGGVAFAPILKKAGVARLTGVEISPAMVRAARDRYRALVERGVLDLREGDAAHLPLGAGAVDKVLSVNTLHQIADARRAFAEAFRVLAPGGRFVLAFRRREFVQRFAPRSNPMKLYGETEVARLLGEAGFEPVEVVPETVGGRETAYALAIADKPAADAPPDDRGGKDPRP